MSAPLQSKIKYSILGLIGIAALAYTIYKTYRRFFKDDKQQPPQTKNTENHTLESNAQDTQPELFIPYEVLVKDSNYRKIRKACVSYLKYLNNIQYNIILQIVKGKQYKGIVKISFYLLKLPKEQDSLKLNFSGNGIKLLLINGKSLKYEQVTYNDHIISISKPLLKEYTQNTIQIIFQNSYSFLNDGLSTYFVIDQHHKYSLRQQVIYTTNDLMSIQHIIPCINCLNQCSVHTEIIHPDRFHVFSNSNKALERYCTHVEYPKYLFLFDQESALKALRKNTFADSGNIFAQSGSQFSDTLSQVTNYNIHKKANSIFNNKELPSIHHFFLMSSMMIEIEPQVYEHNSILDNILIRYYCKQNETQKIKRSINKIHIFILDILRRLQAQISCLIKIDVIVFKDDLSEGAFAPGIMLLSEQSLQQDPLSLKVFYLIVRAIVGMIKLQTTKSKLVSIDDILQLNHQIFVRFQQFRNYLYIKNKKYQILCMKLKQNSFTQEFKQKEGFFARYYSKELKYIIKNDLSDRISFQMQSLMKVFIKDKKEQFWLRFINNYRCFSPLISQPFVKLAISQIGLPYQNIKLLTQLKNCLKESKYIMFFYTNHQISQNLSYFLEKQSFGLEMRLPSLKVKQKYANYITQRYEKYIPVKSNHTDAEIIYGQFKKFNQQKNFHHHQFLKVEINRVLYFLQKDLKGERLDLQCDISGWKLLKRLKIYPLNNNWFELLCQLDETIQKL